VARTFNGTTDKADCGNFADNLATMTVACWIKDSTIAGQLVLAKLSAGGIASGTGWALYFSASGKLVGLIQQGATIFSNPIDSLNVWLDGTWHHIAMTWNGTNCVIYADGEQVATDTMHGAFTSYSNAVNVLLGTDAKPEFFFNGSLAEVGIWNVVLTINELRALAGGVLVPFGGALPYRVRPSALLAYLPLWGFASPEIDLSGNGHTGTLTGTSAANHAPVTLFTPKDRTPVDVTAAVIVPAPPLYPEIRQGPPMRGAPWLQRLPIAEASSLVIAPPPPQPGPGPIAYEIHAGPPMRGAPWLAHLPIENALLFGPRNPPPIPPVLGPGRGVQRPFIERLSDVRDERRLSRITEKISSLLNSLIGTAALQQTGPASWVIRGGAFQQPRPPTNTDDIASGAIPGCFWIDTLGLQGYMCISNAQNAALWKKITS